MCSSLSPWCWTPIASMWITSALRWQSWGRRAPPNQHSWNSSRFETNTLMSNINLTGQSGSLFLIKLFHYFVAVHLNKKSCFAIYLISNAAVHIKTDWYIDFLTKWKSLHQLAILSPTASSGNQQWPNDSVRPDDEAYPEIPSVHFAAAGIVHSYFHLLHSKMQCAAGSVVHVFTSRGSAAFINPALCFSKLRHKARQGNCSEETCFPRLF